MLRGSLYRRLSNQINPTMKNTLTLILVSFGLHGMVVAAPTGNSTETVFQKSSGDRDEKSKSEKKKADERNKPEECKNGEAKKAGEEAERKKSEEARKAALAKKKAEEEKMVRDAMAKMKSLGAEKKKATEARQ